MSQFQKKDSQQNQERKGRSVIQVQPKIHQQTCAPPAVPYGCMSVPPHTTNYYQNGFQCLQTVDQLIVLQKVDLIESFLPYEENNKYAIMNKDGQQMFYAAEDTDLCTRNCCGSLREFEMKIMDRQGNEIIHLSRPFACDSCLFPCCLQKIEVYSPPGCLVGTVEQNWSLFTPMFTIRNELNEEVLKIKGSFCQLACCGHADFKILSKDNHFEVGRIQKQWSGLLNEIFTDADNFSITFPMDLEVRMKAVMLGACFLIDFMYFENNNEVCVS